jgi:hypothetical protein
MRQIATTSGLAISGMWSSPQLTWDRYQSINLVIASDQPGYAVVAQSYDNTNYDTWDTVNNPGNFTPLPANLTASIPTASGISFTVPRKGSTCLIRYFNSGASSQSTFRLYAIMIDNIGT